MKFTKLSSAVFSTATVLATILPVATVSAATEENVPGVNGETMLPMKDKTTVGISFGDNSDNGNDGYLRLQMVPHVLDFGNHKTLLSNYLTFNAEGANKGIDSNNRYASYQNEDKSTNKTAILNTSDEKLGDVTGNAWATVVDKQVMRQKDDGKNTKQSGSWQLKVKSDDVLTGNNGETIPDASISMKDTQYGRTDKVFALTGESKDKNFKSDTSIDDKNVEDVKANINNIILGKGEENYEVANAADSEGQGANVFGWKPENITLTMPSTAKVSNAVYTAHLTWTLSTGIVA